MESRESEKLGCHTMTAPTVLSTGCNMNHSTAEEDLWVSDIRGRIEAAQTLKPGEGESS
ncbi:hypothetical protein WN943_023528 [Citrus x changshan-huyou]